MGRRDTYIYRGLSASHFAGIRDVCDKAMPYTFCDIVNGISVLENTDSDTRLDYEADSLCDICSLSFLRSVIFLECEIIIDLKHRTKVTCKYNQKKKIDFIFCLTNIVVNFKNTDF